MKGQFLKRSVISDATKAQMYRLFCSQFENVSMQQFVADLDEKNWVLLLHNKSGDLIAFSSMHVYETQIGDRNVTLVYSGDTTVDSSTWSDSALSYNIMGAFSWLQRHYNTDHLYWFLLVSGYRTYRLLPVFSEYFYPRFDAPTPQSIQVMMNAMASERFGSNYDAESGIVRLDVPSVLKDGYIDIPENRLADPNVAFFAERNPGHLQGDELLCFAELAESKLTRLGKRMWQKGQKLFPDDA
ncbi:MAG: hypothetical protein GWP67_02480 [Gammaproteobacteria bacterium]|nr:hypothetical protein [Gammaproteobacteria bacterium]